ncbi:hypothetical protein PILCRDRAFT_11410 [Piloderma croceum F 1598]|uniref:Uncharacterized protein n=1 Tax=Piloderma croceum (strain F 1598) TaxID=765440 RepID=A0A0C3FE88_PILCF|nr:hypothetical protein PILCRDRAFT_11410 [Piloderma croceum F 1598]
MAELIANKMMGSDNDRETPCFLRHSKQHTSARTQPQSSVIATGNSFDPLPVEKSSDTDNGDYNGSGSSSSAPSSDSNIKEITNEELADSLATKAVAESSPAAHQKRTKSSKSKKQKVPCKSTESASNPKWTCIEDVQDEVDVAEPSLAPVVVPFAIVPKLKKSETRNLIYLIYETININADGHAGQPGDKHYKCYHGNHKILTVRRAMKSSLNGLTGHLKTHFSTIDPPTEDEKVIAARKCMLDLSQAAEYVGQLERASTSIVEAFKQQQQHNTRSFSLTSMSLSGENMGHAVYDMMKKYGLRGKVNAINCDNASNNDTMMECLEHLHAGDGFEFDAAEARLHCIPHTIHLSTLELLQSIGAVKKGDSEAAYQESVTAPLGHKHDDDAVGQDADDDKESDPLPDSKEVLQEVLLAIEKASSFLFQSVLCS